MSANWLAGALALTFFMYITIKGELVEYAGVIGLGPKS